jgi:hypothetical protein
MIVTDVWYSTCSHVGMKYIRRNPFNKDWLLILSIKSYLLESNAHF